MDIKIKPKLLINEKYLVQVPPSKSVAHRMIIAAALAKGTSEIEGLDLKNTSVDIKTTINGMRLLGALAVEKSMSVSMTGIEKPSVRMEIDCHESGSTLRFLIPIAAALGVETTFIGGGKLPSRPLDVYFNELPKHGVSLSKSQNGENLPLKLSGKLEAGRFEIDGGISSQFITGLLFALPLLDNDSEIVLTSPLQSEPYVDITIDVLNKFGVCVKKTENGYFIGKGQSYKPFSGYVERDFSQAAFFYVAKLLGSNFLVQDIDDHSAQGDKIILDIYHNRSYQNKMEPLSLDCSDIPDLVPILCVLGCFCEGTSELRNVARLRIKECDRLAAMEECLNKLGGNIKVKEDVVLIEGGKKSLSGGVVNAFNDHRIAMSMAIAATRCESELTILGAECVAKSFPNFFDIYKELSGEFEII